MFDLTGSHTLLCFFFLDQAGLLCEDELGNSGLRLLCLL